MIAAGVHLAALEAATGTKRAWTDRVNAIPHGARPGRFLNPRTACRLMELGKSRWSQEAGTPGPKTLDRLPTDIQKLTWLCKLSPGQLGDLLGRMDCKEGGRKAVVDAAKALLPPGGTQGKTPRAHGDLRSFKQAVARTASALKGAADGAGVADIGARLRGAMDEVLARLGDDGRAHASVQPAGIRGKPASGPVPKRDRSVAQPPSSRPRA